MIVFANTEEELFGSVYLKVSSYLYISSFLYWFSLNWFSTNFIADYKFDFEDSIKWSANDIAIVRVEKPFKIGVREDGCDYAACPVNYNNVSRELEKTGTKGHIAGWGTMGGFREVNLMHVNKINIKINCNDLKPVKL